MATAAREGKTAADSLYQRILVAPNDVSTLVTLARVISQCQIPSAELMQQGEFSERAIELLQRALGLQPTDWLARYLLAQHFYRAPAFLNRAAAAATQFDTLLVQQGDRTLLPAFARPFEYRGVLWMRAGSPDSARAVWARGLRIFPKDSGLVKRMESLSAPPAAGQLRSQNAGGSTPSARR